MTEKIEAITIGVSGQYFMKDNEDTHGKYDFKTEINLSENAKNDNEKRSLIIDELLKCVNDAKNKSNAFLSNEMSNEKNKDAPPSKKSKVSNDITPQDLIIKERTTNS